MKKLDIGDYIIFGLLALSALYFLLNGVCGIC